MNKLEKMRAKKAAGEEILKEERIHVAVLADSPNVITGFGNVCREVLGHLYESGFYDFEIVGINYDGSPHDLPHKIYPAVNALVSHMAYREPYGRQRFLDMLGEGRFDLVWVLQDSFIVGEELAQRIKETNDALAPDRKYQFIFYYPIDATPKKSWIDQSALLADFPVTYTQYAYEETMKLYAVDENSLLKPEEKEENLARGKELEAKLNVVYHGMNPKDFYPLEEARIQELRQNLWNDKKDRFVFLNVNRNQPRKDLFRSLQAFKILLDRRRASGKSLPYLYMHCNVFDNNMNMLEMSKQLNLTEGDEWAYPDAKYFGPAAGFPVNVLNDIYNAGDAVISTTLGEGWGLSITEAMAVKRPVIAPDHTSISEILGKTTAGTAERGILVKILPHGFVQQNDNSRIRPITDPEDLADKMEFVMDNRALLQPMVDTAYDWVKMLEWGGPEVGGKWDTIFENAYLNVLTVRSLELDNHLKKAMGVEDLGRNDICPICSAGGAQVKVKNCRHYAKS